MEKLRKFQDAACASRPAEYAVAEIETSSDVTRAFDKQDRAAAVPLIRNIDSRGASPDRAFESVLFPQLDSDNVFLSVHLWSCQSIRRVLHVVNHCPVLVDHPDTKPVQRIRRDSEMSSPVLKDSFVGILLKMFCVSCYQFDRKLLGGRFELSGFQWFRTGVDNVVHSVVRASRGRLRLSPAGYVVSRVSAADAATVFRNRAPKVFLASAYRAGVAF